MNYPRCRIVLVGLMLLTTVLGAQQPPRVRLTRLECGTSPGPIDVNAGSDTYAPAGVRVELTFSCYLVQHGDAYLLWDAGNPLGPAQTAPRTSLPALLGQLQIAAAQIRYVAVSHYHGDHVGQLSAFREATLLIGKGDWNVLTTMRSTDTLRGPGAPAPTAFAHWISGGGKVEPQVGDKDVFGDGTVVMLSTPGHTPGHHSLLVRLREMGPVVLSGDLASFREGYEGNSVLNFNRDRAATLASLDRIKQLARNLNATVIIQHDSRDIAKLPPFPQAAK